MTTPNPARASRRRATRPRLRPRTRTVLSQTAPPTAAPAQPEAPGTINALIHAVMRDMPAIAKNGRNEDDGYEFRQLDDVMATLHGVCVRHGLLIMPVNIETRHAAVKREDGSLSALTQTSVKVTYELSGLCEGSKTVMYAGEGIDKSDKSTAKALSQAWKYLIVQLFMIPVEELRENIDADYTTPVGAPAPTVSREEQASRDRHPSTRARNNGQQRRNGRPRLTSVPVQPTGEHDADAGPPPGGEGDYMTRAANCKTRTEFQSLYLEAAKDTKADPATVVTLQRLLSEWKPRGEKPAIPGHTEHQDQGETTTTGAEHQDAEPAAEPEAPAEEAKVPPTPHEISDVSQQHAAAIESLWEFAQIGGYTEFSDMADAFKEKHGHTLEEAGIDEIESFAAGMLPPGALNGEDEPDSGDDGDDSTD